MGTFIITFCILVALAVIGLGIWAKFNPSTKYRDDAEHEREWQNAIR